ncbi:hypothetical protein ND861_07870 [Leptospira sp. 2 VSF19]|uniref:Lipoprotein n=1 Tax=Leptospira soteropolitanensis TaxID=2950025 RepID=A0AAW5VHI9_9LEPT|nr:hypothetical protein [Leptospira soteropolitanensis]MCW7492911.1 hypothetical protein [Leptospira soteropolitanensis]MCW7500146.1 hypothetical protein [Leptospira soteropolitanensis]MCW7522397.1 hypothetical protein [Leptospira soteropolitanensis]MCW7526253.1 hypothetical protein [Leptospira soteropolitanensis]MCW7529635.1 hypothetical protein [Leptospira soteropolitanensis]
MVRKLLILSLFCSCRLFTIADPNYVEQALLNEKDEGFISREFFQIKVEIPITYKEVSGLARREDCKQRAFIEREKISLPYLLQIQRQKHRLGEGFTEYTASLEGKDRQTRVATNTSQNTTTTTGTQITPTTVATPILLQNAQTTQGQNTTNPSQSSVIGQNLGEVRGNPEEKKENHVENLHNFAWFFDGLELYKEDYSDRTKCAFLFRNIQPKLMERVEKTPISEPRKL